MRLDRRQFIELAGLAGVTLLAPAQVSAAGRPGRTVVFVELSGGNDGLNTVIPAADPLYRRLRPSIAVEAAKLRTIDAETALHPSLTRIAATWDKGELAIVEGVGYPNPNRSHFRSIEIWETGSDADEVLTSGWVSRVGPRSMRAEDHVAPLRIGGGGDGPLEGAGTLELDEPERLVAMARRLRRTSAETDNPALAHVLGAQQELLAAVDALGRFAQSAPSFAGRFGGGAALRPFEVAAELLGSGLGVLALKLRLDGFDTHVNQPNRHARLLELLDRGIGGLREALRAAGRWEDVLVVTYSEFGRRPRENGGGGTDHGAAAPHFVLGGAVRGGRFGARPLLDQLDADGDLVFTTDYRRIYRTLASSWWRLPAEELHEFEGLEFV